MPSRVAELAKCAGGCGFRQCRHYKDLRLCDRCWPKREAIHAVRQREDTIRKEMRKNT